MQVEKSDLSSHCKSCQWDEFHYRFPSAFLPWMTHLFFDRPILPPLFFFNAEARGKERDSGGEKSNHLLCCVQRKASSLILLSMCLLFKKPFVCSVKLFMSLCEWWILIIIFSHCVSTDWCYICIITHLPTFFHCFCLQCLSASHLEWFKKQFLKMSLVIHF